MLNNTTTTDPRPMRTDEIPVSQNVSSIVRSRKQHIVEARRISVTKTRRIREKYITGAETALYSTQNTTTCNIAADKRCNWRHTSSWTFYSCRTLAQQRAKMTAHHSQPEQHISSARRPENKSGYYFLKYIP